MLQHKYSLEFILRLYNATEDAVKTSLSEFGDHIIVSTCEHGMCDLTISMITEDPELVFDVCAQFGRIQSIKVNEHTEEAQGA